LLFRKLAIMLHANCCFPFRRTLSAGTASISSSASLPAGLSARAVPAGVVAYTPSNKSIKYKVSSSIGPDCSIKSCVLYAIKGQFNRVYGRCNMNKYQKVSIYTSIVILALFLVLSLVTQNWRFLLWSLIPVFLVLMTTFLTKNGKQDDRI